VLPHVLLAIIATAVLLIAMLGELLVSRRNERVLQQQGALAPADPGYDAMRWIYPGSFVAMGIEGAFGPPPFVVLTWLGAAVLVLSKALKYWAIASLGTRWTFRVLVLPRAPLVTHGPYRWLRHPNYVAVLGEFVGTALLLNAVGTGILSMVFFGMLLRRRIAIEERALGMK
jgi:methyltransferase